MRGEWIEIIQDKTDMCQKNASLPVRGEWIEILLHFLCLAINLVSPREGRVD